MDPSAPVVNHIESKIAKMRIFLNEVETELQELQGLKEFKQKHTVRNLKEEIAQEAKKLTAHLRNTYTQQVIQLQKQISEHEKNLAAQRTKLHDVEELLDIATHEKINLNTIVEKRAKFDAKRYDKLLAQNMNLREDNDDLRRTNILLKNELRHSSSPRAGKP